MNNSWDLIITTGNAKEKVCEDCKDYICNCVKPINLKPIKKVDYNKHSRDEFKEGE